MSAKWQVFCLGLSVLINYQDVNKMDVILQMALLNTFTWRKICFISIQISSIFVPKNLIGIVAAQVHIMGWYWIGVNSLWPSDAIWQQRSG